MGFKYYDKSQGKYVPMSIEILKSEGVSYTAPLIKSEFDKIDFKIGNIANFKSQGDTLTEKIVNEFSERFINPKWYGAKGDGVFDDSTALQNTLNNKGNIYIPKGKYLVKKTLVVLENTTVLFHPEAEIIRGSQIYCIFTNGKPEDKYLSYNGNGNINLIGGTLDVKGDSIKSNGGGIVFGHSENVVIKNMLIKNIYNIHHIEINSSKNVLIDNCRFENFYHDGTRPYSEAVQIDLAKNESVFPVFGDYDGTVCDNITIQNSTFNKVGAGIGTHVSAHDTWHENIKIFNNTFEDLLHHAVSGLIFRRFHISGNEVKNCWRAFYLAWCYDGNVSNNIIKDTTDHGILIRKTNNVSINGVKIARAGEVGISIYEGSHSIQIDNCTIDEGQNLGINIDGNTITVSNSTIKYNKNHGIYIHNSAKNNKVSFSNVYGNGRHGILITDSSSLNRIEGNFVYANNQTNSNCNNLMVVKNANNNRVINNICRIGDMTNKPQYGLFIEETCSNTLALMNDLRQSGAALNFYDEGQNTITSTENITS
ncbi:right-handed parallel beta-helix repeat-containing protein [Bacillus vallismortis]|uniref:Right-handed parallel beta-helix repeat-containing protein n=1 Tax=Bacillus vallismortis TaxID=72361 RepID=A0AAP3CMK3_BACVA|nr:right-handed parallel beta-helix repeat-containing protein [Bacillus vallismortis]MCY8319149.1 right-handed parallel beta-helix repeat-containing protein [Bacillus vallismortis]